MRSRMLHRLPFVVAGALLTTVSGCHSRADHPKYTIICIGDGMGFEHVKAAGMYAHGAPGTLSFEALPHQGEVTTFSADDLVTDSAAAATAMATGFKVNNGVISVAIPGDGRELETLLEFHSSLGRSTGLVTTTSITHATPAALGAHEPSRDNLAEIAEDYLTQTCPNVLFGGGGNGMSPEAAKASGYVVVTDRESMLALDTEDTWLVSGQFGSTHMPYEYDGLGPLPHLSEMTATALAILDGNPNGFFLMVEGGRVDHAAHDNDIKRNVLETIEFANAVQVVLDWAEGRTDALVLVTADHETGGLTVLQDNGRGQFPKVSWSTKGHTEANVPVYAWGVRSELVSAQMDNTNLSSVMGLDRYGQVAACGSGPQTPTGRCRDHTDPDGDGHVDLADFALFQNTFTNKGP